jgi:hypothetical protein
MEKDRNYQAVTTVLGNFSWKYEELRQRCRKRGRSKKQKLYSRSRTAPPGTSMKNRQQPA